MRLLITGGAGFVGSNLALALRRHHDWRIVCLDNLKRRGSELGLKRLAAGGVEFVHGDVRDPADLETVSPFDFLIECSAEPSVRAGYDGAARQVVETNLNGTFNCLESARRHGAAILFISTSRVYSIAALRALPLVRNGSRLALPHDESGAGWSCQSISESFSTAGSRSLYGTTKLASELLVEEYQAMYAMPAVINRCGVITGPWQMGKIDQGFLVLWAARHLYGGALGYCGFGGDGLQVRDLLHVEDLSDLVRYQINHLDSLNGRTFNVGGGVANSISLRELTALCEARTGRRLSLTSDPATRPDDIPYYVSNNHAVTEATGWKPKQTADQILDDVVNWLADNRNELVPILTH
jgi:CDP-paratose 2-epimerase